MCWCSSAADVKSANYRVRDGDAYFDMLQTLQNKKKKGIENVIKLWEKNLSVYVYVPSISSSRFRGFDSLPVLPLQQYTEGAVR